jgi:hypothetical protein
MDNDDEHRGLCLTLSRLKCMVIISSRPNQIYDGLLPEWRTAEFQVMTRGGTRVEKLWMNFPAPKYLHDPRFAGKDRRERHRMAKRVKRWKGKYMRMSGAERQQVFAELAAMDPEVVKLWESTK